MPEPPPEHAGPRAPTLPEALTATGSRSASRRQAREVTCAPGISPDRPPLTEVVQRETALVRGPRLEALGPEVHGRRHDGGAGASDRDARTTQAAGRAPSRPRASAERVERPRSKARPSPRTLPAAGSEALTPRGIPLALPSLLQSRPLWPSQQPSGGGNKLREVQQLARGHTASVPRAGYGHVLAGCAGAVPWRPGPDDDAHLVRRCDLCLEIRVQDQGAGRPGPSARASPFFSSGLQATLGVPWTVDPSPDLCLHPHLASACGRVCVQISPPAIGLGPSLMSSL